VAGEDTIQSDHFRRRREFITLLGGVAAAWPLAARAQQPAMPVVGFLGAGVASEWTRLIAAFHQGLKEAGFVEGQNVHIEYRWAEANYDQLPMLATDLAHRQVAVIVAMTAPSAFAVKMATSAIPIVFSVGSDPVKLGLVESLNRPGGNVTGVNYLTQELGPKRLGLLRELMPAGADVFVLVNPKSPATESALQDMHAAASAVGHRSFQSCTRATIRSSMQRFRQWRKGGPRPSCSSPTRCSLAGACNWLRWRRVTPFRQSAPHANLRTSAV
jgi:putative ABC transport system substrate-binding protein